MTQILNHVAGKMVIPVSIVNESATLVFLSKG